MNLDELFERLVEKELKEKLSPEVDSEWMKKHLVVTGLTKENKEKGE